MRPAAPPLLEVAHEENELPPSSLSARESRQPSNMRIEVPAGTVGAGPLSAPSCVAQMAGGGNVTAGGSGVGAFWFLAFFACTVERRVCRTGRRAAAAVAVVALLATTLALAGVVEG